jgi:hypothetical protein
MAQARVRTAQGQVEAAVAAGVENNDPCLQKSQFVVAEVDLLTCARNSTYLEDPRDSCSNMNLGCMNMLKLRGYGCMMVDSTGAHYLRLT